MASKPLPLLALADVLERRLMCNGLEIEATVDPESPILKTFYAGYDEAFVLPNEKEELDGFIKCLALNQGDRYLSLAERYGPFREVVLIARHPTSGTIVGGANFIAFPLHCDRQVLSINLNYIFVCPRQRRRGHFKQLVASIGDVATTFFQPTSNHCPRFIFIEQNDPVQMSVADYELDTQHSGIDQVQRIQLWTSLGAKIIDFPYVQPPLSDFQLPDTTLVYAVLGAGGDALDACLLYAHLLRFFAISVLKGGDPWSSPVAAAELVELDSRCREGATIPLLTASHLPSLIAGTGGERSLRELIRPSA